MSYYLKCDCLSHGAGSPARELQGPLFAVLLIGLTITWQRTFSLADVCKGHYLNCKTTQARTLSRKHQKHGCYSIWLMRVTWHSRPRFAQLAACVRQNTWQHQGKRSKRSILCCLRKLLGRWPTSHSLSGFSLKKQFTPYFVEVLRRSRMLSMQYALQMFCFLMPAFQHLFLLFLLCLP